MMALLELSGVTHTYDSANNSWWKSKQKLQGAVVKDISMTLEAGQCIGLLGGAVQARVHSAKSCLACSALNGAQYLLMVRICMLATIERKNNYGSMYRPYFRIVILR